MEDKSKKPGTPQQGQGENRGGATQGSNLNTNRQDTSKDQQRKVSADNDSELERTDENEVPDTSKQEQKNQDQNLKR